MDEGYIVNEINRKHARRWAAGIGAGVGFFGFTVGVILAAVILTMIYRDYSIFSVFYVCGGYPFIGAFLGAIGGFIFGLFVNLNEISRWKKILVAAAGGLLAAIVGAAPFVISSISPGNLSGEFFDGLLYASCISFVLGILVVIMALGLSIYRQLAPRYDWLTWKGWFG